MPTAAEIIARLELRPHPEGGHYRETFRDQATDASGRSRSTLIYFLLALGIGPVGAAFYAWDIGMKRGDIRVLGAASYATPLLSTGFLIAAGFAKASANIAIAAILIAGGGLIAAKDMVLRKR